MKALRSVLSSGARSFWLHRHRDVIEKSAAVRRPRLLVDVSVIIRHDAQTGIQRVVRAIWHNLISQSYEFDVLPVYATPTHGYRFANADFLVRRANNQFQSDVVRVHPGDKFLGLDLSAHLLPAYQRQISSWRTAGATVHLVVYDLLPIVRSHWFNPRTVQSFARWIEIVRNHCDQALCISGHVADELDAFLESDRIRPAIGRIRLAGDLEGSFPSRGIDPELQGLIDQFRRRPTILMVGTIEPRKGYDVALAAFEHLWRTRSEDAPALAIVGKPGWQTEKLQEAIRTHPEQGHRLHWLANVSDEGLGELYRVCSGVFLASHAEGFGLPAVEAAMHGQRALVRDLQVFREQNLANLIFFDDDRAPALATRLQDLLDRPAIPTASPSLPNWSDCVTDLVSQLGFDGADGPVSGAQAHANA